MTSLLDRSLHSTTDSVLLQHTCTLPSRKASASLRLWQWRIFLPLTPYTQLTPIASLGEDQDTCRVYGLQQDVVTYRGLQSRVHMYEHGSIHVTPAQLTRPGIGRNASCASGDCLTSRPKGRSWPRELWFSIYSCTYMYIWAVVLQCSAEPPYSGCLWAMNCGCNLMKMQI